MEWTIVGAGAIGCLWGASLQQAGFGVTLVLRDATRLQQFRRAGGIRLTREGNESLHRVKATLAGDCGPIERLLLCTKAFDTEAALRAVLPRLTPNARVLVLQNGLGNQQLAGELVGPWRLAIGSTTDGAWLRAPFEVVHAGRGQTRIGASDADSSDLVAELPDDFSLEVCSDPDIETTLWRKLAVNCAINPLTAIHACRNGDLVRIARYREELIRLCDEFELVARARGTQLFDRPLAEQAQNVAAATGDNFSSMLQDIRHRRTTEIEQITGYLCREAERLGIAVPTHRAMLEQVRKLEATQHRRDSNHG
ncbi:putative 2-dehydropantoate 2-reductase [Marinobacterium nitratireducens]|uniref:2-dehydropantoate 2-reductase n=1 Tax=Marinobacterium nitratireducens TaxID=518897 RepID=A0A918DUG1_9GAMM|nr:2-dehydropantoate 2-reductase [Marinobacterium nitratireducens]GGO82933.1 putative 2-dehydropantoate 2-reductase [Marinobacterium nitratireducens]